jgi:hypothetical protein
MSASGTVQVRLSMGGKDVRVEGPDDADVVVSVGRADVDVDPTVAYMTGRLKTTGSTGVLLGALADGSIAASLKRLASAV